MNYSNDPSMVRVDFFKQGGKWYTTEAVKWLANGTKYSLINEEFKESLIAHLRNERGEIRLGGMTAVCLDPYHENSHPQMVTVPEGLPIYVGRAKCGGCLERNGGFRTVAPIWNGSIWVCPECNNNLNHQSEETAPGVWRELP